jgi:hypothetical protein
MTTQTKDAALSVRITSADRDGLNALAALGAGSPANLARSYISEGVRRSRFPAIDFRDGFPGRVAYLTGTRWAVWLIADLAKELGGDVEAVSKRVRRPVALVSMALRYAEQYPDEIAAAQQCAQDREAAA